MKKIFTHCDNFLVYFPEEKCLYFVTRGIKRITYYGRGTPKISTLETSSSCNSVRDLFSQNSTQRSNVNRARCVTSKFPQIHKDPHRHNIHQKVVTRWPGNSFVNVDERTRRAAINAGRNFSLLMETNLAEVSRTGPPLS